MCLCFFAEGPLPIIMQDLLFNVFLDDGVGSNSLAEDSFHICSKFNAKLDTQSLKLFLWNNSYLYSSIFD